MGQKFSSSSSCVVWTAALPFHKAAFHCGGERAYDATDQSWCAENISSDQRLCNESMRTDQRLCNSLLCTPGLLSVPWWQQIDQMLGNAGKLGTLTADAHKERCSECIAQQLRNIQMGYLCLVAGQGLVKTVYARLYAHTRKQHV